jgi:hypothetical protein
MPRDEQAITAKKEEILEMVRKMATSEDGYDYVNDIAVAGAELVTLEKEL